MNNYNPYESDENRYYSPEGNTQNKPLPNSNEVGSFIRTMGVAVALNYVNLGLMISGIGVLMEAIKIVMSGGLK